jgi:ABC-type antimicrobial peptide transport system permease subunit
MNAKKPPRIGTWLLRRFIDRDMRDRVLGDFEEIYRSVVDKKGAISGALWYWIQVSKSIPSFIRVMVYWRIAMIRNYLLVTLRNIKRHWGYSLINIFGLAMGMTCCILIFMWVLDELSFDRFHENGNRIYRVNKIWRKGVTAHYATTPAPLAEALKTDFPEIVDATRIRNIGPLLMANGERVFREPNGIFVDPVFFRMFSFPFIKGEPAAALSDPFSIILTERLSQKYFGHEDPIGKVIRINNRQDFTVRGIVANAPMNSHIQFDYIMTYGLIPMIEPPTSYDWHNVLYYTYVLLEQNADSRHVNEKIADYLKKPIPESTSTLYLQPLKRIHLHSSHLRLTVSNSGRIQTVSLFSAMALFILIIACVNFMNLTTARSSQRAREVGMRKVVGARRFQLIGQFVGESVVLICIAFILAVLLIQILIPFFNTLSGKSIRLGTLIHHYFLLGIFGIGLVTAVLSCGYPAMVLSSFQPVDVLRGGSQGTPKGYLFRRIMVVFQFFLTVTLIIGMIVVYRQLQFIQNREIGFDKDHLVILPISDEIRERYDIFKKELSEIPAVINVSGSVSAPTWGYDNTTLSVDWPGKRSDQEILMHGVGVDYDFFRTFKMDIIDGRTFSRAFSTDTVNFILNESAVQAIGFKDPVGQWFRFGEKEGTIVGIVKDYHYRSLHVPIQPLFMRIYAPRWIQFLFIRMDSRDIPGTVKIIEETWKGVSPNTPFQFTFVNDLLNSMYQTEQRIGVLFRYFTALAIVIACLGLFGLASFVAEQRTKEIGIRKVLGASSSGIVLMLSKEFGKWIIMANIIAWPVGYFVMNLLLQNYAYKIRIGFDIMLLSGLIALLVAMISVSYQSMRAASANPVNSLRYE